MRKSEENELREINVENKRVNEYYFNENELRKFKSTLPSFRKYTCGILVLNILMMLLSFVCIVLFFLIYYYDDSYIKPFRACPSNWMDKTLQLFNKTKECPKDQAVIPNSQNTATIERLAVAQFFCAIFLFMTLECINNFSRVTKVKIIYLVNICLYKDENKDVKKLINLHPQFRSGYKIQYLTVINGIIATFTKIFANCDVHVTPIDIFALVTGTSAIYVFWQSVGYFCKCAFLIRKIEEPNENPLKKKYIFDVLSKIFEYEETNKATNWKIKDFLLFFLIIICNLIIFILFCIATNFYYHDVYMPFPGATANDQETYCRCQYYKENGRGRHISIFIFSYVSLFLSSTVLSLVMAKKNLLIKEKCNLQLKFLCDEAQKNLTPPPKDKDKVKFNLSDISDNDADVKYKDLISCAIQSGIVLSLSNDAIYNWCTNDAAVEYFFLGIAAFFSAINGLYYLFKMLVQMFSCCEEESCCKCSRETYELIENINYNID